MDKQPPSSGQDAEPGPSGSHSADDDKTHMGFQAAELPQVQQQLTKKKTNVGYRNPDEPHTPAPAAKAEQDSPPSTYSGGAAAPAGRMLAGSALAFLDPPAEPGELGRLGNYRVLSQLGTGGMGMVFHAEDITLRRPVALKILKPELQSDAGAWQRVLREARTMAAVKHDHLVTVYQVGREGDVIYIVMELLQGESLEARNKRGPRLSASEIVRIGREIAAGLAAIHQSGMIHRDIKPSNIWLEAGSGRIRILDFGLARPIENSNLTQSGTIVGTPAFMSPEQARGDELDARSDLFSLGSVMYYMATGTHPFQGKTLMSQLTSLAVDTPKPILEASIPAVLSGFILHLLSKTAADRPPSAEAVQNHLKQIDAVLNGTAPASSAKWTLQQETQAASSTPQKPAGLQKSWAAALLIIVAIFSIILLLPKLDPRNAQNLSMQPPPAPPRKVISEKPPESRPTRPTTPRTFDNGPELARAELPTLKAGDVYLIDMPVKEMGFVYFAKESGKKGSPEPGAPKDVFDHMSAAGTPAPHGIGMHPSPRGPAFLDIAVGQKFKTFNALISQNDSPEPALNPMRFRVIGDNKVLWTSKPISADKDLQRCSVSIENVNVLSLEVDCEGEPRGAHALWFEPYLEK